MLSPAEFCKLIVAEQKDIVLPASVEGYGLTSGVRYKEGRNRLDSADREGRILVFWEEPAVTIETEFLGKIPTADNLYNVEAAIKFKIVRPGAVYQHLLQEAEVLLVEIFSQDVSQRMESILSKLACRFAPEALVDGPAQADGKRFLESELTRIYDWQGLEAAEVDLRCVRNFGDQFQPQLLAKRIRREAEEQDLAVEDAFQRYKKELGAVAENVDQKLQTVLARVDNVQSFVALDEEPTEEERQIECDPNAPSATARTKPILVGSKTQAGGRFAVLSSRESPRYYKILRPWFFIGRDENCHVSLPRAVVSSLHATIARPGSGLAVVDHNSVNGTFFNGERIAQRFVETNDLLRVGDYWLVFKLEPGQEFREIDRSCRGAIASSGQTVPAAKQAFDDSDEQGVGGDGLVRLVSTAGRWATSDSRPILIGSDSSCDLRLGGGGAARFHAVVYWDVVIDASGKVADGGVFLEDLHSGRGSLQNGQPIQRTKLGNGDKIEVGGHRITVTLQGNAPSRAKTLYAAKPSTRGLAITCIEGPGNGHMTTRLDPKMPRVLLGRDNDCDLILHGKEVSGKHAEITAEMLECEDGAYRPQFMVNDLNTTNGTLVNGWNLTPTQPKKIGPGDLIRLSRGKQHCDFLVHYEL